MKYLLLFLLFFITSSKEAQSQPNLVVNGSFEVYNRLPFTNRMFRGLDSLFVARSLTEIYFVYTVPGWSVPGPFTPDFFESDSCIGKACAGLITTTEAQYREFLQMELSQVMIKDSSYKIEFYLRTFSKTKVSVHEVDPLSLGFLFDTVKRSPHNIRFPVIDKPPYYIQVPSLQRGEWKKILFEYKAAGGEKYITLGNFLHDDQIPGLSETSPEKRFGYILIDEFSIIPKFTITENSRGTVSMQFNYDKDAFELSSDHKTNLLEILQEFDNNYCSSFKIKISAFSSEEGKEEYNYLLSAKRAEKIKEFLIGNGQDEEMIELEFFGETQCSGDCRKAKVQLTCN